MKRVPPRKRARLWAGLYLAIFGTDDETTEEADDESQADTDQEGEQDDARRRGSK